MELGGRRHDPAALPSGKTRYPLYRKLGGLTDDLDGCWKTLPRRDSIPRLSESLYRLSYSGPHAGICSGVLENLFRRQRNFYDLTETRNLSPRLQLSTAQLPTSYEFQYCGVIWHIWSHCVLVTEMSPWRWQYYRQKSVVKNTAMKIHLWN